MKKLLLCTTVLSVLVVFLLTDHTYAAPGDCIPDAITETDYSETNNAIVTFCCIMPDYFTLGTYVEIENEDTGDIYRITATASNDYIARMYIPPGSYRILMCGVYDDVTSEYPMETPDDFVIEYGANHNIFSTLTEYDEIEKAAGERMDADREPSTEPVDDSNKVRDTAKKPVKQPLPWRVITHTGEGHGNVEINGVSAAAYDFVIEITKTGRVKEGEFRYSTDGGNTWSEDSVILSRVSVYDTKNGEDTGMDILFDASDDFLNYDEYRLSTTYEYEAEKDVHIGGGEILFSSEDILYDTDYRHFKVKISKSGNNGEACFKYSPNSNIWSEDIQIPENGEVSLLDNKLKLTFSDINGEFKVGDTYISEITGKERERDYRLIIIVILLITVISIIIFMIHELEKMEKPKDYSLNVYVKRGGSKK